MDSHLQISARLSQIRERDCALCPLSTDPGTVKGVSKRLDLVQRKAFLKELSMRAEMLLKGSELPATRDVQVAAVSLQREVEHSKGEGRGAWTQCWSPWGPGEGSWGQEPHPPLAM